VTEEKFRREEIMKKTIFGAVIAAALFVLASPATHANTVSMVRAYIPFDFVAADQKVPAGEYWFEQRESRTGLFMYGKDMKFSIAMACLPLEVPNQDRGYIVFHRYGTQYFLKAIRAGSVSFGATLPVSRAEKEWRKFGGGTAAMLSIALH
jgi:hypothetical protein